MPDIKPKNTVRGYKDNDEVVRRGISDISAALFDDEVSESDFKRIFSRVSAQFREEKRDHPLQYEAQIDSGKTLVEVATDLHSNMGGAPKSHVEKALGNPTASRMAGIRDYLIAQRQELEVGRPLGKPTGVTQVGAS